MLKAHASISFTNPGTEHWIFHADICAQSGMHAIDSSHLKGTVVDSSKHIPDGSKVEYHVCFILLKSEVIS